MAKGKRGPGEARGEQGSGSKRTTSQGRERGWQPGREEGVLTEGQKTWVGILTLLEVPDSAGGSCLTLCLSFHMYLFIYVWPAVFKTLARETNPRAPVLRGLVRVSRAVTPQV